MDESTRTSRMARSVLNVVYGVWHDRAAGLATDFARIEVVRRWRLTKSATRSSNVFTIDV